MTIAPASVGAIVLAKPLSNTVCETYAYVCVKFS